MSGRITTGRPMTMTIGEFRNRLAAVFAENEATPLPNTGLRAVLCEADRMADEYVAFLSRPIPLPPDAFPATPGGEAKP